MEINGVDSLIRRVAPYDDAVDEIRGSIDAGIILQVTAVELGLARGCVCYRITDVILRPVLL